MSDIKQVIVIRTDLKNTEGYKVRTGKIIAQACHASIAFLTNKLRLSQMLSEVEEKWIWDSFAKVCLQVNSESELLRIYKEAREAGLEVNLIQDSGLTEFGGIKTFTCLAIGPDYAEKIDVITKELKLY